jgi:DNA-binding NtrC family response regulator
LTHEETMLARLLADHLGAVTGAAAQLARSRARELEAEQALVVGRERERELALVIERHGRRQRALAEVMARPARVASYSPAAHDALFAAERLGESERAVAMLVPPGVDAMPWAAVMHLASPRSGGALVAVDATMPADQLVERWQAAETSPFEVARDGTLVVVDPQRLPPEAQRLCGAQLPGDVGLVLVVPGRAALESLDEHLRARVGERVLALPALAERAEDLRALALHHLSRIGERVRARPYGLSLRAQQLLNDYEWPGNDAELEAVLLRAALGCGDGDVIDAADLARIIGRSDPAKPLRSAR